MKFCLISRQISHTFRCFNKSNNFQNDFYEINSIFPKTKQTMSEHKKPPKTTSSAKTTLEDRHQIIANHSKECPQRSSQEIRTQNEPNVGFNSNFKSDPNVNPYNNWAQNSWVYSQPVFTPFNGYTPYLPQSAYYPMNGQMYAQMNGQMYGQMNGQMSGQMYGQMNGQMSGYQTFYQKGNQMNFSPSNHSRGMCTQHTNGPISDEEVKRIVTECRQMITTKHNVDIDSNEFRFSIMTYNILSQNLLEDHSDLYQHCPPSALKWPQRGQRILRELLDSDCDIICLQEVHSQHFEELFMPALKESGYNGVYKPRTGGKMDGCAIVYKENKFELLNEIKLDFMRKDLSSVLDRDNIAVVVELKPLQIKSGSKIIVANTHLLYNPKRGDVKLAQMRLLMAEIDKIAKISQKDNVFDYNPIILCGDLNSEPNSLIYDFITKGSANFNGFRVGDISGQRGGFGRGRTVEEHHLQLLGVTSDTRFENSSDTKKQIEEKMSIKHNFKLKSVILRFEDRFRNKLISSANCLDSGLVDYIFYNYKKLRVCEFQRLLTQHKLQQMGGIPNNILGSDHFSIKAIFSII